MGILTTGIGGGTAGTPGTPGAAAVDPTLFAELYGEDIGYDEEFTRAGAIELPADLSWNNQGSATYVERFGAGVIGLPAVAATARGLVRALPSESTWEATMFLSDAINSQAGSDAHQFGLCLRDSASGKLMVLRRGSTSGVRLTRFDDNSLTNGANIGTQQLGYAAGIQGFRVRRNSATSWDFEYSADGGISWIRVVMAQNITSHLTPNQLGFYAVNNIGAVCEFAIHALRVRET